jgi:hypothetical protein
MESSSSELPSIISEITRLISGIIFLFLSVIAFILYSAAFPSSLGLYLKSRLVRVGLFSSALARASSPEAPIWLFQRLRLVRTVLF